MHLFNRDIVSMPDKWEYPWVRGGREEEEGRRREGGRGREKDDFKIYFYFLSLSSYSMLHGI